MRNTYKDGMLNGYNAELQNYMNFPLSQFAQRLFYNQTLYTKLTGKKDPPGELFAFLADCKIISDQKMPDGGNYTPIVGTRYHTGMWDGALLDLATWRLYEKADFNRDYQVGNDEMFAAVQSGLVDFTTFPGIQKRFELTRLITAQMQRGFTGLNRDDGVFKFAKQQAIFIPTGTWDVGSLISQSEGQFEVGIMDFPVPAADDPKYGYWMPAPRFEKSAAQANFAVTKFSKHPEIAIDFMLFLTSQKGNEQLNKTFRWIPAIRNTKMNEILTRFQPSVMGINGNFPYPLGGQTQVYWTQQYSLFQVDQISVSELIKRLSNYYNKEGMLDFQEQQKDWRRGAPSTERISSTERAIAMQASAVPGAQTDAVWGKYASLSLSIVNGELDKRRILLLATEGKKKKVSAPYDYSPAALARIRAQASAAANP